MKETTNQSPRPAVQSPCIGVCALDADNVCHGCGRTLYEILAWSVMTDDQKRRWLAARSPKGEPNYEKNRC